MTLIGVIVFCWACLGGLAAYLIGTWQKDELIDLTERLGSEPSERRSPCDQVRWALHEYLDSVGAEVR